MISRRGVEGRLRKLELARRPPDCAFYLCWGRDEAEARESLSKARANGTVSVGDIVVCAAWSGPDGMPPCRWIPNSGRDLSNGLSPEEDEVLSAAMTRRCDEVRELIDGINHGLPVGVGPEYLDRLRSGPRYLDVNRLTDEELIAVGLGETLQ